MPWVHPDHAQALMDKYAGALDESGEEIDADAAAGDAAAAERGPSRDSPEHSSQAGLGGSLPTACAAEPAGATPAPAQEQKKKRSVKAATTELVGHLRAGQVREALQLSLLYDHALTPQTSGAIAESAAIVYPLAVALRKSGHVELAARYVQRYGLHACPVCSLDRFGNNARGDEPTIAGKTATRCVSCTSLPLHELVCDLVSIGNFDGVFRLCSDPRLAGPPHSLARHFPPALVLRQALAQPRFTFVDGVKSLERWDLVRHMPLFRRWIIDEIKELSIPGSTLAVSSTMLRMAISGLLDGTQCQPESPALAAAVGLQLGSVSADTARMSLPETYHVPVLLNRLAEIDPKATLGVLRKWYPANVSTHYSGKTGAKTQQRPSGSIEWKPDDFGLHPARVVERLIYFNQNCGDASGRDVSRDDRPSLLSLLSSVEFISHFALQAAFPQVLRSLLEAGEMNSAVKFSHGASPDCIEAQTLTLVHVAQTEVLPVPFEAQVNQANAATAGTGSQRMNRSGAMLRPGGTAALLAVNFNPTKKSTLPIADHMWTLRDSSPLTMSELRCDIVVVDCPEALCKAESTLKPLLKQAASAVSARQQQQDQAATDRKRRHQLPATNADGYRKQEQEQSHQLDQEVEIEWPSPRVHGYPLLGLDTESPPVRKKGAKSRVSLLQVVTATHLQTFHFRMQNRPLQRLPCRSLTTAAVGIQHTARFPI